MKFFTLLVALCAVFATSNAQYCQNMFGKSFYFQEVEQLCEDLSSYDIQNIQGWTAIYAQWDYGDVETWRNFIGEYSVVRYAETEVEDVERYVFEYRENYTDFYISALEDNKQHIDWATANLTFIQADVMLYLFELDAALKMTDLILSARPECGMSDRQNLISEAVSNTSNYVQTGVATMMDANMYLYGIIHPQILNQFVMLLGSAISDMFSPMDAIEFLDLHYLESTRSLLHKELDLVSHSMMYNINAGILATLTNERAWLLDLLQTADTWQCYENVNQ